MNSTTYIKLDTQVINSYLYTPGNRVNFTNSVKYYVHCGLKQKKILS